ncbi:Hypothetical predicted protein [Octopus vulgaris]|uniref:Uncharacterized protein n=1 Tax=Octopus vulgaris TaxID=6645 RepID=A0AA36EZV3_OCTVU|nr:Hypothetical predicted protein [Octopus vulgaris]
MGCMEISGIIGKKHIDDGGGTAPWGGRYCDNDGVFIVVALDGCDDGDGGSGICNGGVEFEIFWSDICVIFTGIDDVADIVAGFGIVFGINEEVTVDDSAGGDDEADTDDEEEDIVTAVFVFVVVVVVVVAAVAVVIVYIVAVFSDGLNRGVVSDAVVVVGSVVFVVSSAVVCVDVTGAAVENLVVSKAASNDVILEVSAKLFRI